MRKLVQSRNDPEMIPTMAAEETTFPVQKHASSIKLSGTVSWRSAKQVIRMVGL